MIQLPAAKPRKAAENGSVLKKQHSRTRGAGHARSDPELAWHMEQMMKA